MTTQGDDTGPRLFLGEDLEVAVLSSFATGQVALFTARSTDKAPGKCNEDASGMFSLGARSAVIAIADGCGGMPRGGEAAALAIRSLRSTLATVVDEEHLRPAILNAVENADDAIKALGVGAATTLVVAEIHDDTVRAYHIGDSGLMVVGSRGKVRFQTIAHSPVGYAVESGMLDERRAMVHVDRNLVSNVLGIEEMRIDIGPRIQMRSRDTLLLRSDGLFDNLRQAEIVEHIRKGPIDVAASELQAHCQRRMAADGTTPCKPDDLTFAIFRRH